MDDRDTEVLILGGRQVRTILDGAEAGVVEQIRQAYLTHGRGDSALPHSTFLTFPGKARERIIALPAFLGGDFDVAGMKWISSFPENKQEGMDRASAVIVVNSTRTGRPRAILEGAAISAARTAASAALAGHVLKSGTTMPEAAFIGCGPINLEIARYLRALEPDLNRFVLFDLQPEQAERQAVHLRALFPGCEAEVAASMDEALGAAAVVSFATTAIEPHVHDLAPCRPDATILHISLRDLAPEVILACDNTTDDVDHACRARTSLHLAEQRTGARNFIRCTLADVLSGAAPPRRPEGGRAVFSPFGLGVLDMAVAQWVVAEAEAQGMGTRVDMFATAAEPAAAV